MFSIAKGSFQIYRVFDLGEEINLSQVKENLSAFIKNEWSIKQSSKPSIIIKNPPLSLLLHSEDVKIAGRTHTAKISMKLYDYGACSVQINIPLKNVKSEQLIEMQADIETNTNIDVLARNKVSDIFKQINTSIKMPVMWHVFEDYTIIFSEKINVYSKNQDDPKKESSSVLNDPKTILDSKLAQILIGEKKENLSKLMVSETLATNLQYSNNDLTVIDWNSAFIYDPQANTDICELLEFVLTHQLEMRYYNQQLEYKKKILYENFDKKNESLYKVQNLFTNLSVQASQIYLDFSEFISKLDNSIEIVGDVYLSKVIDAADKKFNEKLRKQLEKNLNELKDESDSLSNKIKSEQSNLLSFLIVLLIIAELKFWSYIPDLFNWVLKLFGYTF